MGKGIFKNRKICDSHYEGTILSLWITFDNKKKPAYHRWCILISINATQCLMWITNYSPHSGVFNTLSINCIPHDKCSLWYEKMLHNTQPRSKLFFNGGPLFPGVVWSEFHCETVKAFNTKPIGNECRSSTRILTHQQLHT